MTDLPISAFYHFSLRDSTPRALSLTAGYRSYYPSLIKNVLLCASELTAFSQVLERDMNSGPHIKSLAVYRSRRDSENQVSIPLSQLDSLVSSTSNQYQSYKAVPRSK